MIAKTEPEKQLTVAQVAELLDCSPTTIYRDCDNGTLKFHKLGKAGKRFSWTKHIVPYLERNQEEKPRPQRLTGKKATLKHLDLT